MQCTACDDAPDGVKYVYRNGQLSSSDTNSGNYYAAVGSVSSTWFSVEYASTRYGFVGDGSEVGP